MEYKFKGSVEIRFPEDKEIKATGEDELDALKNLIGMLVDNDEIDDYLNTDYLKISKKRKIFTIVVKEVHEHTVTIDTDDYDDIDDEYDAKRYVDDNLDDFTDDFEYDCWSRQSFEVDCVDEREEEEQC